MAALSAIPGLQERFYHKSLSFEISVGMSNEKVNQDEPSAMTRIERSVSRMTPEEMKSFAQIVAQACPNSHGQRFCSCDREF
jgi:hypothetical protein